MCSVNTSHNEPRPKVMNIMYFRVFHYCLPEPSFKATLEHLQGCHHATRSHSSYTTSLITSPRRDRSQPSAASVFQTIISFFSFVPVSLNVYIHTHTHTYMGTYIYKYKVYVNSVSVSAHLTNLIFGIL